MAHKKILIVDDESVNITLLDQLVDPLHIVYFSRNGKDAMEKAEQLSPDLILLDIILPDINGIEVCKALKKNSRTENIPVIIVSAIKPQQYAEEIKELGITDYFVKPFNSTNVRKKLTAYLA